MIAPILLASLVAVAAVPAPKAAAAPRPVAYQPAACSTLRESVGPQQSPSGMYGALMAEALHRHGFDAQYPRIDRAALAKAELDWAGCFTPDAVPAAGRKR